VCVHLQDAPVWQQPAGVAEAIQGLHKELQALQETQGKQWRLPEEQAQVLRKVRRTWGVLV